MPNRDELRKVEYEISNVGTDKAIGYFHRWGKIIQYDNNDGAHSVVVGVVEAKDGQVMCLDPRRIKFSDVVMVKNLS